MEEKQEKEVTREQKRINENNSASGFSWEQKKTFQAIFMVVRKYK